MAERTLAQGLARVRTDEAQQPSALASSCSQTAGAEAVIKTEDDAPSTELNHSPETSTCLGAATSTQSNNSESSLVKTDHGVTSFTHPTSGQSSHVKTIHGAKTIIHPTSSGSSHVKTIHGAKTATHPTSSGSSHVKTGHIAATPTQPSSLPSPSSSPTSLPNFLRVPVWETALTNTKPSSGAASAPTTAAATSQSEGESGAAKPESDIKVYVESTMNELLGWYGLSKMDNADTSQLTIGHFPTALSQRSPSRPESTTSGAAKSPTCARPGYRRNERRSSGLYESIKPSSDTNNNSSSCGADDEDEDDRDVGDEDDCGGFRDSFGAVDDVGDLVLPESGGGEVPDCERGVPIICSWCQHPGNKSFTLETAYGVKSFCSELCFTQCRRASFKRNKVCEWCKHVRHTLNFVDFQDGDVQLQFCSEKCLNQYKMNIFCTEASQHLKQIQDMACDQPNAGSDRGGNQEKEILITPELWLSAQTSSKVAIKQEVNEEEHVKPHDEHGNEGKSKSHLDGMEPGEVQDPLSRWTAGLEMIVSAGVSDHSSCSNEVKVGHKAKSPLMHRPRKDRPTSRAPTTKGSPKPAPDPCHHTDRDRIRKLLTGASLTDPPQTHSPSTSSLKERTDSHANQSPLKNLSLQPPLGGAAFIPQQMSSLPLLPNWASSQLFTMMPSHLNPALAAASSLGGLGYASNPLLYSSLFSQSPIALAAHKELAATALAKSRNQARRELLRDRSMEADRINIRGESAERSTRSTSSSYSSSDTPGPSSTPGATMAAGAEFAQGFVPAFAQQLPLHNPDLGQPLPHYLTEPAGPAMFPLAYSLSQAPRPGATQVPPHMPAPAGTQPAPHSVPPPVTILVPYPVAVPIPVPVPIPLPIAPEKFFAFFREKSAQAKAAANSAGPQQWAPDHRPAPPTEGRSRPSSNSQTIDISPAASPQLSSKSQPLGRHLEPVMKSPGPGPAMSSGRASADSIITMRREVAGLQQKLISASLLSSSGSKRTSVSPFTADRCKKARLDYPPFSAEDVAIDLSKLSSRSTTPRVPVNCPEKDNSILVKQESFSDSDVDCSSQSSSATTAPRIHIISDQADLGMGSSSAALGLPTASQQSSYSGRRSRILDAPSVPKKLRSPSPERRYIRTVPRDMVEAARRRGLRARVRTK